MAFKSTPETILVLRDAAAHLNNRGLSELPANTICDVADDLESMARSMPMLMLGVTVDTAFAAYQAGLLAKDALINVIAKSVAATSAPPD